MSIDIKQLPRWYFGGLASACAVCVTHPLDLIKVHLQTHKGRAISLLQITGSIIKNEGILALYNGISASIFRQLTYSTTRFAIYDYAKANIDMSSFTTKMAVAAVGGTVGGWVGAPADLVNVRLQNDMKLPKKQRRNYKHAIDGVYRVIKTEGLPRLFTGSSTASMRAGVLTIGQIAVYDHSKYLFLRLQLFRDNIVTHVLASFIAGIAVTILAQPLDVLKTRLMSAKKGEFAGIMQCVVLTNKEGMKAFYKGTIPAAVRHVPNAVIIFIIYEKLTYNYGYIQIKYKK
ncbi:unnamed protein product [Psylliodes chrysocephalus]|uniref:Mitochondrial dicarboxylate carrier n=1 Tax=Psylliodes chrysocephalus TaxID=3402493 RepID=A0A9P0CMT8_9CUCU|nr:unnamed protein product [Psylliodes chrysocephala]